SAGTRSATPASRSTSSSPASARALEARRRRSLHEPVAPGACASCSPASARAYDPNSTRRSWRVKALTWQGRRDVQVQVVPDPTIEKPDDVIVQVTSTGICGSDLHL